MPFFIVLFFYITISIYQISAVADALKLILMVQSTFLEGILFIVSLFLTFTPLIGPILGIIGATFVWEWNIFFSEVQICVEVSLFIEFCEFSNVLPDCY